MTRRGSTLIELLIGLVLLAMVGTAITQTLVMASRSTVRSLSQLEIARTVVSTGALVREELGQGGSDEVQVASPGQLDMARQIGGASSCGSAGFRVLLRLSAWWGVRWPAGARDQAELLTDAASGQWVRQPIDSVATASCPDGTPALALALGAPAGTASFVRITEPVRLRGYSSGPSGWWGLAPADGLSPVQPFAGPLSSPWSIALLAPSLLALHFHPVGATDTTLRIPLGPP